MTYNPRLQRGKGYKFVTTDRKERARPLFTEIGPTAKESATVLTRKAARSGPDRAACLGRRRWRAESVENHDVIDHSQIACVRVIDTHASPRFDRGLHNPSRFVQYAAGAVENVTTRTIRSILADDKRL